MKIHCAQLVEGALRSALAPGAGESHPPAVITQTNQAKTLLDSLSPPKQANPKITFLPKNK